MSAPAESGDTPGQVLISNYSWHQVLGTPHPPWKNVSDRDDVGVVAAYQGNWGGNKNNPRLLNDEDDGTHAAAASSTAKEWLDAGVEGCSAVATPVVDTTRRGGAHICSGTGDGDALPVASGLIVEDGVWYS